MNPSRPAILLYGSLVYVLFLGTFLYCMGFVMDLIVPKTIDTVVGAPDPLWKAISVNASILGLFAVQHLIMARQWFKKRWTRIIPPAAERSTFVLFTCAILVLLFWQWRAIPGVVWDVQAPWARVTLQALSAIGFLGVVFVTFLIDHFGLFGLRQAVANFRGQPASTPDFQVRSLYRFCRHPMYAAFFTAFWCAPTMTVGHLLFAGLCTGFVLFAVRFEERDLGTEHGDAYADYQRDVPMILPRVWRPANGVKLCTDLRDPISSVA